VIELSPLPNERRHFFHKRIGAAVKGFVLSGGNPLAAGAALLAPTRRTLPRSQTARPTIFSEQGKGLGRRIKFGGGVAVGTVGTTAFQSLQRGGGCLVPGMRRDPVSGECKFFIGDRPGPDSAPLRLGGGLPGGEVVMGRYGAAEMPGSRIVDRATCRRGMILGDDDLCYNKGQISNKQRQWPRGRRPLLTGGDMRAISIAARAGARLERTSKRLQKIGLMKKPARGASRRQIAAEVRTEMHHSK